jgi:hypothetical protein
MKEREEGDDSHGGTGRGGSQSFCSWYMALQCQSRRCSGSCASGSGHTRVVLGVSSWDIIGVA